MRSTRRFLSIQCFSQFLHANSTVSSQSLFRVCLSLCLFSYSYVFSRVSFVYAAVELSALHSATSSPCRSWYLTWPADSGGNGAIFNVHAREEEILGSVA